MATDSILFDILDAVRTTIQGLDLPGIAPANVVIQKVATNRVKDLPAERYPAICIAPYGPETFFTAGGTNLRDDIIYPVGIWILASDNIEGEQPGQQQENNFRLYLKWRQLIRHTFHNQTLSGVTTVYTSQVQPLDVIDRSWWLTKGVVVSGMVAKFTSREVRT